MSSRRSPERREVDGQDIETVVKILPEPPRPTSSTRSPVRRRDQAHIHLDRLGPPTCSNSAPE